MAEKLQGSLGEISQLQGALGEIPQLLGRLSEGVMYVSGDCIVSEQSLMDFPTLGNSHTLYVSISENKVYRWNEDNLKYYVVGSDYNEIETINGGNANG